MIRIVPLVAIAISCLWLAPSQGQTRKFPYEAVITENETYVRSGPGSRYYPTARLSQGTKVVVHRHDPGGWYMIAPPEGSFSWIRADYVQTNGQKTGTVTENQVVVRVGTVFGDKREVEQRRLSRGDRVKILGEKSFNTPEGLVHMFKIAPPRGEFRWVPGQFVAAADSIAERTPSRPTTEKPQPQPQSKQPTEDPFAKSSSQSATRTTENPGVVRTEQPQATPQEVERLAELDRQFRETVRRKTAAWNFAEIEQGYQELARSASTPAFKDQLDQRFAALAKYQKIKDQYDDFLRLTQETAKRDAQILSGSGMRPETISRPRSPAPTITKQAPQKSTTATNPEVARMSGAGIIQRAIVDAPNGPEYVLVSPQGKVLAFLSHAQVDLSKHLGKPRGIFGPRTFRTDLQMDFIEVESVTPVRLKR